MFLKMWNTFGGWILDIKMMKKWNHLFNKTELMIHKYFILALGRIRW